MQGAMPRTWRRRDRARGQRRQRRCAALRRRASQTTTQRPAAMLGKKIGGVITTYSKVLHARLNPRLPVSLSLSLPPIQAMHDRQCF
jgi:hypothetical protein